MNIFGNIGKNIANVARNVFNQAFRTPPQTYGNPNSGLSFVIAAGIPGFQAINRALFHIFLDKSVSAQLLHQMGEAGVAIVKDVLSPIQRKHPSPIIDSFRYKIDLTNNSVSIYSTHPGAYAIQYGIERAGSADAIEDWMQEKPEFDGLDAKQSRRVSFAIRAAINSGMKPGPLSTLGRLPPVGERRFDYVAEASTRLDGEIRNLINAFASTMNM